MSTLAATQMPRAGGRFNGLFQGHLSVCLQGLIALASVVPAWAAQATSADLGPSEVLVSVCGGLSNGNGWGPGGSVGMVTGRSDCQSATTTQPGNTAGRTVGYSEAGVSATSQAQAQFGELKLGASYAGSPQVAGLPAAVAQGGWNDTLTVTPANPSDAGKLATFSFLISVEGSLDAAASGNTGVGLSMLALRDGGFFGSAWSSVGQGQQFQPFHRNLDEAVLLSVPIYLGTPFQLGFFAAAYAGYASSLPGSGQGNADFLNTLTWGGVNAVSINGAPVAYTLASTSGVNWAQPFVPVPEPTSALLILCGGGLLLRQRLRAPKPPRG